MSTLATCEAQAEAPTTAVPAAVASAAAAAAAATVAAGHQRAATLIPNRVFVGGCPSNAGEAELKEFFSTFGEVRDVKIIMDKSGMSKGYGFVTFESAEIAEFIIKRHLHDGLEFKQRKLNIGPAIKKNPLYYRPDQNNNGVFFTSGSVPYTYQNGMAVFHVPGSLYYHHQPHGAPLQHQLQQQQHLTVGGDMQFAPQHYSVAAAAAAAAAAVSASAPTGQVAAAAQLMCLPAGPFTGAIWPSASTQSPGTLQNCATSGAYYSAAFGALPCYSSPLTRTPVMGLPTEGGFMSATSDYGTDASYTDQSYANESADYEAGAVCYQHPCYNHHRIHHPNQQHFHHQLPAAAYSPAYCYGSPPVLCPMRAYPLLLNPQPQPPMATPPPPAPVARIAGAAGGTCCEAADEMVERLPPPQQHAATAAACGSSA